MDVSGVGVATEIEYIKYKQKVVIGTGGIKNEGKMHAMVCFILHVAARFDKSDRLIGKKCNGV